MNGSDALDAPLFFQGDEDRLKAEIQERWTRTLQQTAAAAHSANDACRKEYWPVGGGPFADRAVATPPNAKNGHLTRAERVLLLLKGGEWVPGWKLCDPAAGGSEGLRRLRELRAAGWLIEMRKREGRASREYRLTGRKDGK